MVQEIKDNSQIKEKLRISIFEGSKHSKCLNLKNKNFKIALFFQKKFQNNKKIKLNEEYEKEYQVKKPTGIIAQLKSSCDINHLLIKLILQVRAVVAVIVVIIFIYKSYYITQDQEQNIKKLNGVINFIMQIVIKQMFKIRKIVSNYFNHLKYNQFYQNSITKINQQDQMNNERTIRESISIRNQNPSFLGQIDFSNSYKQNYFQQNKQFFKQVIKTLDLLDFKSISKSKYQLIRLKIYIKYTKIYLILKKYSKNFNIKLTQFNKQNIEKKVVWLELKDKEDILKELQQILEQLQEKIELLESDQRIKQIKAKQMIEQLKKSKTNKKKLINKFKIQKILKKNYKRLAKKQLQQLDYKDESINKLRIEIEKLQNERFNLNDLLQAEKLNSKKEIKAANLASKSEIENLNKLIYQRNNEIENARNEKKEIKTINIPKKIIKQNYKLNKMKQNNQKNKFKIQLNQIIIIFYIIYIQRNLEKEVKNQQQINTQQRKELQLKEQNIINFKQYQIEKITEAWKKFTIKYSEAEFNENQAEKLLSERLNYFRNNLERAQKDIQIQKDMNKLLEEQKLDYFTQLNITQQNIGKFYAQLNELTKQNLKQNSDSQVEKKFEIISRIIIIIIILIRIIRIVKLSEKLRLESDFFEEEKQQLNNKFESNKEIMYKKNSENEADLKQQIQLNIMEIKNLKIEIEEKIKKINDCENQILQNEEELRQKELLIQRLK